MRNIAFDLSLYGGGLTQNLNGIENFNVLFHFSKPARPF